MVFQFTLDFFASVTADIPSKARAALSWRPEIICLFPFCGVFYGISNLGLNLMPAVRTDATSLLDEMMCRCQGAYSPRTLSGYQNDLKCFQIWCQMHARDWLPAHPEAIAEFVDSQIESSRISTIKRRISAITFAHRMTDLPEPTNHSAVRLAIRRASRARAQRPDQVRGLTHDILSRVLELQPTTLADLRDTALLGVGYDTLCRSSEIALMLVNHQRRDPSGDISIIIPRSKGDATGKGRIAHLSPMTVERLNCWLEAAGIADGSIFQGLHLGLPSGRPLGASSIRRIVKRVVQRAGFPNSIAEQFSGHSMRIGAAQDMMVAGFDILAIMQAGGWTTPHVVARYVERASTRRLHERRWAALSGA
jgi:site-specific recombinase XerD